MELELELELKIMELELELNWKNGIDPNPGHKQYDTLRPEPNGHHLADISKCIFFFSNKFIDICSLELNSQ